MSKFTLKLAQFNFFNKYRLINKPYGDDVREQKDESEQVSVPGSTEAFKSHHEQGQSDDGAEQ